MKVNGRHVIYALILLVAGFMFSYSYHFAKKREVPSYLAESEWRKMDSLRSEMIDAQNKNGELYARLRQLQHTVHEIEHSEANNEERAKNLIKELEKLRKLTGTVKVEGPGIVVTLHDAEYIPEKDNPNDYIVHEHHIQTVVQELLVSGAEAIAVNGQRISFNSYILCIGPVVEVDGIQHFAPFTITAIGNNELMHSSLNLKGNIKDQLVQEGIEVSIEKKSDIVIDPFLSEKGRGV